MKEISYLVFLLFFLSLGLGRCGIFFGLVLTGFWHLSQSFIGHGGHQIILNISSYLAALKLSNIKKILSKEIHPDTRISHTKKGKISGIKLIQTTFQFSKLNSITSK
jgi:hypothetical protein